MNHESTPIYRGPLPRFQRPSCGLFVDRWGTLLDLPSKGYASRFEDVQFQPGALEALFRAHRAGWQLYLIGNEDQVASGRQSDASWEKLRSALEEHLMQHGIVVKRFYAALDRPEGKGPHQGDSVFLLPNTGAFYQAHHLDGIELERSWVVGDSTLELVAGWRAGLRMAGVRTGLGLGDGAYEVDPEIVAPDLASALHAVMQAEGSPQPKAA